MQASATSAALGLLCDAWCLRSIDVAALNRAATSRTLTALAAAENGEACISPVTCDATLGLRLVVLPLLLMLSSHAVACSRSAAVALLIKHPRTAGSSSAVTSPRATHCSRVV